MPSAIPLILAAGMLYAASRAAVIALARPEGSDPGRRALGHWLPIAAVVFAAVLMHQPEIAVAIVFGTSVASLSLVLGLATFMSPLTELPATRKVWPFIFPVVLLALLAGFSGHLNWIHALMLLALGGAILGVWLQAPPELQDQPKHSEFPVSRLTAVILLLLALALSYYGARFAVIGTISTAANARSMSAPALAGTILSALLVLPMLGTTLTTAQAGHGARAITALVGTVLLNLCLTLPIAIFLWLLVAEGRAHFSLGEIVAGANSSRTLPYPIIAWRIETVVLLVLAFVLVPISMGRWIISRLESTLLICGYVAYMLSVAVLGLQIG